MELRPPAARPIATGEVSADLIAKPPKGTTHVVLDTPAGLHGWSFNDVMKIANKVIVPLQSSVFDIFATAVAGDLRLAGCVSGPLRCHFVAHLTSNPAAPRYSSVMKVFQTLSELSSLVGQEVAVSDWITITQQQVNLFAEATGDHQWIHVDPEKARAGPFGGPIAHGFLTLSLLPKFFESSFEITGSRLGVNYGLNKVRFTAPVPVGSRLRARMKLLAAEPIDNAGMQMNWEVTVEREGSAKPVCVAESLVRRYP